MQTRAMSFIESCTNIFVGYILAIMTQIIVFPWFGLEAKAHEHFTIALIFTLISLGRSFCLRRIFNKIGMKK